MRKILYSPKYGAGWSTWADDKMRDFMLFYEPLIEAIESGTGIKEAIEQFEKDCQDKFGEIPYMGGVGNLKVYTIYNNEKFIIKEYDGFESVVLESDINWL